MTQPDAPVNGIHAGIAAVINEIDVAVYRFAAGGPQADGVVSRDAPIGSGGKRCRATSPWANSPLISNGASPQPDEACGSHVTLLGAPVGQDDP